MFTKQRKEQGKLDNREITTKILEEILDKVDKRRNNSWKGFKE